MSKQKNDDLEVAKRTREYINFFINEYINWGDLTELFCFSFNEMNKAFNSNFKLYFNIKSCLMLEELLEYIELINDTSWKSRCSILQQLDYDKFYCNHCSNGDLRLHSAFYVASIGHITGECKNKD